MKQELFTETFKIGDNEYPSTLSQDLDVNRQDLNGEFIRHSERFAWYATAYELSLDIEMRLKAKLERLYAVLDHRVRQEADMAAVKMTEKKVENTVITRPEYIEMQDQYFSAAKETGLLKAGRDAMIHRRDMLISLGANFRSETRSDVSLLTKEYQGVRNG